MSNDDKYVVDRDLRLVRELITLLNCAEADLLGYWNESDEDNSPTFKTIRELHNKLVQLQPGHACSLGRGPLVIVDAIRSARPVVKWVEIS